MAKTTEGRKKIEALKIGASCLFPKEEEIKVQGYVQRANTQAKLKGEFKDDTKFSFDANPKIQGYVSVTRNY